MTQNGPLKIFSLPWILQARIKSVDRLSSLEPFQKAISPQRTSSGISAAFLAILGHLNILVQKRSICPPSVRDMSARCLPVVREMSVSGHLVDRYGQVRTNLVPGCLSLGSRTFGGHKADTWRTLGGHMADTWRTLVSLLDLTPFEQFQKNERV